MEKLVRLVRDLRRLCVNFVNFQDLYSGQRTATFQCGVLYLDQRSCSLCLTVADAARHAALAGLSGAYLAYCDCVRRGGSEKMGIVAIVSQGDDDNLMVGRNGLFYDRQGRDWDATITSIVASAISLRQAFWSPYKKAARFIEETIAKRATAKQADAQAALTTGPAAPPKKMAFDPSVIALSAVALGSLATAFSGFLAYMYGLPLSAIPILMAAILVLISMPSLVLAWLKLRRADPLPNPDANDGPSTRGPKSTFPLASG